MKDPLYIGLKQKRERGAAYDALVDEFMNAVVKRYSKGTDVNPCERRFWMLTMIMMMVLVIVMLIMMMMVPVVMEVVVIMPGIPLAKKWCWGPMSYPWLSVRLSVSLSVDVVCNIIRLNWITVYLVVEQLCFFWQVVEFCASRVSGQNIRKDFFKTIKVDFKFCWQVSYKHPYTGFPHPGCNVWDE